MTKLLQTFFLLLPLTVLAQSYTVESVPNAKLINNSYVSNPDGILQEATVAHINQLLDTLELKTTAQVAVVVLNSIGEEDIFDFAQQLFIRWGIGQASNDNGLLILFVMDKHTIRFHTGFGVESVLPDARCKRIQQEYMVPHFKNSDYDQGMLLGVQRTVALLSSPEAVKEIESSAEETEPFYLYIFLMMVHAGLVFIMFLIALALQKFKGQGDVPKIRVSKKGWFLLYVILPFTILFIAFNLEWSYSLFFITLYAYSVFVFLEKYQRIGSIAAPYEKKGDTQKLYHFYVRQRLVWIASAIFFPLPMVFIYLAFRRTLRGIRNLPRTCKTCGASSIKLTEQTEDEFLKPGQIKEETIGTVDYDVWKCTSCGSVETLNYPTATTKYLPCPKCSFVTYHIGKRRSIMSATYHRPGRAEEERNCLNCGHSHIEVFSIPMLVATSSSSSSSSSGSSSSRGGSWGGGDSGGGGASSSW